MRRLAMILLVSVFASDVRGQQERPFEGLFDRLMKNFETDMDRQMKRFEKLFQGGSFTGMDRMFADIDASGVEPFWRDTKKERILVFKVDASEKGIPFNIQIKEGGIVVKGTVKKQERITDPTTGGTSFSSNVYQFQHGPIPVPRDVDEGGVKIEKKGDEVLIRFPKKQAGVINKKFQKKPDGGSLPRRKGDVTI